MEKEEIDVRSEFQRGSLEAFEILFRQHERLVHRWILRIVRNEATAEDLTVETFWRIYRAHARFDAARAFEPWARRIATRAALDWLRTARSDCGLSAELSSKEESDPAVSAELRQKTTLALGRLPPKLRIAVTLAVVEELPYKEIAGALGTSVAAVKVRVFRALRFLRKDLQQQGITP